MELLSPHFSYEEAIASQTAARLGIDNTPSVAILKNMVEAASNLERVRTGLGNLPITISSWYRCPELNAAIGGAASSAHMQGWAIDFNCRQYGKLIDVVKATVRCGGFDQVIWEFDSWCHVSFAPTMRGEVLTIRRGTGYMKGLIS